MPPPNLPFVAAKYVLGLTTNDQLVEVADAVLTSGVYSYSLGRLYDLSPADRTWKAAPLFIAALKELAIPLPSEEAAVRIVLTRYLAGIAEGTWTPVKGMRLFWREVVRPSGRLHAPPAVQAAPEWPDLRKWCQWGGVRSHLDGGIGEFAAQWTRAHLPAQVDPSLLDWNGGAVRDLARAIADESRFDDLPILADALEEAGCADAALLEHCRWPGEHVRGCWVLSLIAGRERE